MEPWQRFDHASADDARLMFQQCCGSSRWAERMVAARPFGSRGDLLDAARDEWFSLTPDDWREAFSHHPKIGERSKVATTREMSEREQAGVASAEADVLAQLADANRRYEEKFGYIFIVCATGKSAEEMLALLRVRLHNDTQAEIRVAAAEQAKITELRLVS
jgi:2-oxo-4-hydroxy-4-carboxy-5-ureidoimidazoline decarboxylase